MMTFLLCLGSVAPAFAADKKKGYNAAAAKSQCRKYGRITSRNIVKFFLNQPHRRFQMCDALCTVFVAPNMGICISQPG